MKSKSKTLGYLPRFPCLRATSADPAPLFNTSLRAVACGDTRKLRKKFEAGADPPLIRFKHFCIVLKWLHATQEFISIIL